MTYIPLDRCFVTWEERKGELVEPFELLKWWPSDGITWSQLEAHHRVVLLAEAGSGKTEELKERVRLKAAQNEYVFSCTVQAVASAGLEGSLRNDARSELAAWRHSDRPAWFFVDSVDEAKLDGQRLETALSRLADGIDGALRRAHVILTSRITDWEFPGDLRLFEEILPVPPEPAIPEVMPGDRILTSVLSGEYRRQKSQKPQADKTTLERPKIVLMAPLDEFRVRMFAQAQGIADVDRFIGAIAAGDLWTFASRPQDLLWLSTYWRVHGRFGSLAAMMTVSLHERLLETNPHHARTDPIAPERGGAAAERIGAAMIFSRTERLAVPDSEIAMRSSGVGMRLEQVLPDWSEEHRRRLMTRPLFDPTTFGYLRLHGDNLGEVRSYLAARWLRQRRQRDCSARALRDLLFADLYGYALVKPSMTQTAAWLALRDNEVAREVIGRSPQLLLTEGDPGSLSALTRATVLTTIIEQMAHTGEGFGFIMDEKLRRFSTSELAPTVNALWVQHHNNAGCRVLLLRLVYLGTLTDCLAVATDAVFGGYPDEVTQMLGGRAFVAAADPQRLAQYVEHVRRDGAQLPGRLVWDAIDQLFMRGLSVDDLLALMATMDPPTRNQGLDDHGLRCIERLMTQADHERLLTGLLALEGALEFESGPEKAGTRRHWRLLVTLAHRLLRQVGASEVPENAMEIAVRVRAANPHLPYDEDLKTLIENLTATSLRRQQVFWYVARKLAGHPILRGRPLERVWDMTILGWSLGLAEADLPWLLEDAPRRASDAEAALAMDAALDIWQRTGRQTNVLQQIQAVAESDARLASVVAQWLTPPQPSPGLQRQQAELAALHAEHRDHAAARDQSWKEFVEQLRRDPDQLRHLPRPTRESVDSRLYYLWQLLSNMDGRSRYAIEDVGPLEPIVGPEVTDAFRDGLSQFWRQWTPTLESSRPPDQRNVVNNVDCMGICSVSVEARFVASWPAGLTAKEATRAARYATLELSGFPVWLEKLTELWPAQVAEVLLRETLAHVDNPPPEPHVGILQDLEYASVNVAAAVAPALLVALHTRPDLPPKVLSSVLGTLSRALPLATTDFVTLALERARVPTSPEVAGLYLAAVLSRDPVATMAELRHRWDGLDDTGRRQLMEVILPQLFGGSLFDREHVPPDLPLGVLEHLVILAFEAVRLSDDPVRESGLVFSPGPRDTASRARDVLLRHLSSIPGRATVDALRRLQRTPGIGIPPEAFDRLCVARALADCETSPWAPEEAAALEQEFDALPKNTHELQAVALRRLGEIEDTWRDGEQSMGRLVQKLENENEVQRWVA